MTFLNSCNRLFAINNLNLRENDILKVGIGTQMEEVKILNIDAANSRIRVLRNQNNLGKFMFNVTKKSLKWGDNELVLDESILVSSNYIKQIIEELKQKKTDFRKLRQIIADSQVRDFEELYRALFDHASEYAIGREGSVAIIFLSPSFTS